MKAAGALQSGKYKHKKRMLGDVECQYVRFLPGDACISDWQICAVLEYALEAAMSSTEATGGGHPKSK